MNFRRYKFRILLSLLCIVATALPLVGIILTIAESPNPFGFLDPLSSPAFFVLDALDRFLPLPYVDGPLLRTPWFPHQLVALFPGRLANGLHREPSLEPEDLGRGTSSAEDYYELERRSPQGAGSRDHY